MATPRNRRPLACRPFLEFKDQASHGQLSKQQAAVAELVAKGETDKEIARTLGLSEHTVGSYLKGIYRRLGIHSRTALVRHWLARNREAQRPPSGVRMTTAPTSGPLRKKQLSNRQAVVAELVAKGQTDKEIARSLGLSEHTVGSYLKEIYRRLGIHSRAALARDWLARNREAQRPPSGVRTTTATTSGPFRKKYPVNAFARRRRARTEG